MLDEHAQAAILSRPVEYGSEIGFFNFLEIKRNTESGEESPKMWDTEETLTRKVALTLICGSAKTRNEMLVGWECAPPQKSERYSIYLGKGKVLRTSPVEGITETADGITIETANSLYEVNFLN